jgi:hypothetical protein
VHVDSEGGSYYIVKLTKLPSVNLFEHILATQCKQATINSIMQVCGQTLAKTALAELDVRPVAGCEVSAQAELDVCMLAVASSMHA